MAFLQNLDGIVPRIQSICSKTVPIGTNISLTLCLSERERDAECKNFPHWNFSQKLSSKMTRKRSFINPTKLCSLSPSYWTLKWKERSGWFLYISSNTLSQSIVIVRAVWFIPACSTLNSEMDKNTVDGLEFPMHQSLSIKRSTLKWMNILPREATSSF